MDDRPEQRLDGMLHLAGRALTAFRHTLLDGCRRDRCLGSEAGAQRLAVDARVVGTAL